MIGAGIAALAVGLFLVRARFAATSGAGRVLVLGPVFEAVALAIFATEHFLAARNLSSIVPRWLPGPLFWTYFVGAALLAAAISFIAWRCVRWSASLLAMLFLIIVATIDLPNLPGHTHERLFWTLTVRETCFAGGAMVLAGSLWPRGRWAGATLISSGRLLVACTFVFYAVEHFLFLRFVPGVPLEKMTPAWVPVPTLLAYIVGTTLLAAGVGLTIRRTRRHQCGHRAGAAHGLLLHAHPRDGDPFSAGGGRSQLCGRYLTVCSDSFVGGLRRGRPREPRRLLARHRQGSLRRGRGQAEVAILCDSVETPFRRDTSPLHGSF
jgi:uncharacterized membrane protein